MPKYTKALILCLLFNPYVTTAPSTPSSDSFNPDDYATLAKFLHRYSCSSETETALHKAMDQTLLNRFKYNGIHKIQTAHGVYFAKGPSVDRMITALRIKRLIESNPDNFSNVDVADKCWSRQLHQVISKEVKPIRPYNPHDSNDQDATHNFRQAIGLEDWDNHPGNIFPTQDPVTKTIKYVLIDTEESSFKHRSTESPNVQSILYETRYNDPDIDFDQALTQYIALKDAFFQNRFCLYQDPAYIKTYQKLTE